jgi:hypothetical protein
MHCEKLRGQAFDKRAHVALQLRYTLREAFDSLKIELNLVDKNLISSRCTCYVTDLLTKCFKSTKRSLVFRCGCTYAKSIAAYPIDGCRPFTDQTIPLVILRA